MRFLALDVGNRRVGVAVGSSEARIATPLAVIERGRIEDNVTQLRALIAEYDVEGLVVGLPRNANDTASEQEALTRAYMAKLEPQLGLPIQYQDECYSTASAMQQQRARGVNEKRGRATIDAAAAAIILQDFLDGLETPG